MLQVIGSFGLNAKALIKIGKPALNELQYMLVQLMGYLAAGEWQQLSMCEREPGEKVWHLAGMKSSNYTVGSEK